MKFSEYARSKGRTTTIGDDIFIRWSDRRKKFSVDKKTLEKDGVLFELKFHGAPFRVRTDEGFAPVPQDAGESFLASWLPTICVGTTDSLPVVQFKFSSTLEAERAWSALMRRIGLGLIYSLGDVSRAVKEVTRYPLTGKADEAIGKIEFSNSESENAKQVNRAATALLIKEANGEPLLIPDWKYEDGAEGLILAQGEPEPPKLDDEEN